MLFLFYSGFVYFCYQNVFDWHETFKCETLNKPLRGQILFHITVYNYLYDLSEWEWLPWFGSEEHFQTLFPSAMPSKTETNIHLLCFSSLSLLPSLPPCSFLLLGSEAVAVVVADQPLIWVRGGSAPLMHLLSWSAWLWRCCPVTLWKDCGRLE